MFVFALTCSLEALVTAHIGSIDQSSQHTGIFATGTGLYSLSPNINDQPNHFAIDIDLDLDISAYTPSTNASPS